MHMTFMLSAGDNGLDVATIAFLDVSWLPL